MGPLDQILGMMPGMNSKAMKGMKVDDKDLKHVEAIIYSMTPREREKPMLINGSRRARIAAGSGTSVQEVNRLLKQFDQMKKMMKQMQGFNEKKLQKEGIEVGVMDLRFVKPLDIDTLTSLKAKKWFVFSDNNKIGGVAESLQAVNNEYSLHKKIISFEFGDKFIPHGQTSDLEKYLKVDVDSLTNRIKKHLNDI